MITVVDKFLALYEENLVEKIKAGMALAKRTPADVKWAQKRYASSFTGVAPINQGGRKEALALRG